jgi:hypothetical protein
MTNPVRPAPCCQVYDDHPRHIVATETGEEAFHMDCHAAQGCELCQLQRDGVAKNVTGEKFREHLLGLAPKQIEHGEDLAVAGVETVEA